ncbi:MAG TPA: type II toxin-antitoxin system HigB family toxin [Rhizomicrobium sp.]|jgi:mRNA interferase HigB|nr:type II toxin-antitoxin system HigB family toxin [Rhizomicrobium sp.]
MQVIAKRTLKRFWLKHAAAEQPLRNWHAVVAKADWKRPADAKAMFGAAVDFLGDNRLIFDIGGNKYRLVVHVSYAYRRVLIKFIGTHKDYDRIDPETV